MTTEIPMSKSQIPMKSQLSMANGRAYKGPITFPVPTLKKNFLHMKSTSSDKMWTNRIAK
jgi:hypothetical protein